MQNKTGREINPSVVYRNGDPTPPDYDDAINRLQEAQTQTSADGRACAVCGDTGHYAWECSHNPLVMARRAVQKECTWRCFHCGETFYDTASAEEHFGKKDEGPCECIASGHFLVVRLRARIQELMGQLIMGLTPEEKAQLMSRNYSPETGRAQDPEWPPRRINVVDPPRIIPDLTNKELKVWSPELRARIRKTLARGEELQAMIRRMIPRRRRNL